MAHKVFIQETEPTLSDGVEVNSFWFKSSTSALSRCTSVSPVTFAAYAEPDASVYLRGDQAYASVAAGVAWGNVTGTLGNQTDLQAALDAKETPAGAQTKVDTHAGVAAPHSGHAATSHAHAIADTTGLQTALDGKAVTGHTHAQLHDRQHSVTAAADHTFPGGTTTFLRADGTFAAPPGGSEAFPIGSVFMAVVSTNPATLLGYGTWAAIAAGRVLVGLDSGDADFDTAEETGGAKTHTLTTAEMPVHTHAVTDNGHAHNQQRHGTSTGGLTGITTAPDTTSSNPTAMGPNTASATTGITLGNAGSGNAHNNVQPYFVVYMWKRTA